MSTVTSSLGRSRNSAQLHVRCRPGRPMEKLHPSRGVCGVGPADRTGKSLVTYWPGGTRPAFSAESWRLRWNPRETGLMKAILPHRRNRRHSGPRISTMTGDKNPHRLFVKSHCDYWEGRLMLYPVGATEVGGAATLVTDHGWAGVVAPGLIGEKVASPGD